MKSASEPEGKSVHSKFVPIRDKPYTAGCKQVYGQKPLAPGKFTKELKALREGILMNALMEIHGTERAQHIK